MMTLAKMSAGAGYAYYTRETVTQDVQRDPGRSVADYYLQTGNPAGVWEGRLAGTLGLSGQVSEDQMRRLFRDGHHPDTDEKLGKRFFQFKNGKSELAELIEGRTAAFVARHGRAPSERELTALQMGVGDELYRATHGVGPASKRDLWVWMSSQGKPRHAVSGFDLTFSAPKSVSVAWAVGDRDVSTMIEDAHVKAIQDTLDWFERNHAYGRSASGSVKVDGVMATRFRHWTNRNGEPHLHDHVTVSVKVWDREAGKYRSLDARQLYPNMMPMSAMYNRLMVEQLEERGLSFHNEGVGGHVQMELDGITRDVRDVFSTRHRGIVQSMDRQVKEFVRQHGRAPSERERHLLDQKAWQGTRRPKKSVSLGQIKAAAREKLAEAGADGPVRTPVVSRRGRTGGQVDLDAGADEIVSQLQDERSAWCDNHIATKVNMWAVAHHVGSDAVEELTGKVQDRCVLLTPEVEVPAGWSPHLVGGGKRFFTSVEVMRAETRIIDAARIEAQPSVFSASFEAARAEFDGPLDAGQVAVARAFCCDTKAVTVASGHAGAGKTTAMKLVAQAAAKDGVRVVGLSTSERATRVLGSEADIESHNLARWLSGYDAAGNRLVLGAGDLIVVDEASMVSTTHLDAVIANARQAGARVCLLGDEKQLGAIGSGGMFTWLVDHGGAARLEELHRFADPGEADASVRLGQSGDVDFYLDRGRVHGVAASSLPAVVAQRWQTLTGEGLDVIVTTPVNEQAATVAAEIQMLRVIDGDVDLSVSVTGRDGNQIGVGDEVITRCNEPGLVAMTDAQRAAVRRGKGSVCGRTVANGDRWTVTGIGETGSVTLRDKRGASVTAPRSYVRSAVQLGYASTVHVAQGQTVDRSLAVVDAAVSSRESLYVQMTRGRSGNEVFVGLDGTASAEQVVVDVAGRKDSGLSAHEFAEAEKARVGQASTFIPALRADFKRADQQRFTDMIREAVTMWGPEDKELLTQELVAPEGGRRTLDNALRFAERSGIRPDDALRVALTDGDLGEQPYRAMVWRINRIGEQARTNPTGHAPTSVELATMTDDELTTLASATKANRAAALDRMQQAWGQVRDTPRMSRLRNGVQVAPWTGREHGMLTDAQLKVAFTDGLAQVREADREVRQAQQRVAQLRDRWSRLRAEGAGLLSEPSRQTAVALEQARGEVKQWQERAGQARSHVADLAGERRVRSRLDGPSWKRETATREVAAGQGREQVVARTWDAGVEAERAQAQWDSARTMDAAVRAEQRRRLLVPRPAPWRRQAPAWMGVSGAMADERVPEQVQRQLKVKTDFVVGRADAVGARLAAAPVKPAWVDRELGPVPEDPRGRRQWQRVAGRVETYRQVADYHDPDRSLPVPETPPQRREVGALRAEMADVRAGREEVSPTASSRIEWEDRRVRQNRRQRQVDSQAQSRAMNEQARQRQVQREQADQRRTWQVRRDDQMQPGRDDRSVDQPDLDDPDDVEIGDR